MAGSVPEAICTSCILPPSHQRASRTRAARRHSTKLLDGDQRSRSGYFFEPGALDLEGFGRNAGRVDCPKGVRSNSSFGARLAISSIAAHHSRDFRSERFRAIGIFSLISLLTPRVTNGGAGSDPSGPGTRRSDSRRRGRPLRAARRSAAASVVRGDRSRRGS